MSSNQQDQRDAVTLGEVDAPELFNFGPDVEPPLGGPQAALPPWLAEEAPAGQTLTARLAPAGPADAGDVDEELTPEPVMVPEFARVVPAPRRRRKPVPADDVVIAAPAVVDGADKAAAAESESEIETETGIEITPLLPAQRAGVAQDNPESTEDDKPVLARRPRRWARLTQAAAIVAVGATVGIYAAGGLGFLENRTKANPPTAEASAWVLNNLAGAGSVLVPSSMTDTLVQNGQDSAALTTYQTGSRAPIDLSKNCCSYLVVIGGPGEEPGAELPESVRTLFDRSRPAAAFHTAGGWTQIRQVLPGSPEKVAAGLAADHKALVATGTSLVDSGKVELGDVAKQQLRSGEVDARVLLGIVAVALQHKITIASFPAQPGEVDPGILRRSAAISEIDGKAVKDSSDRVKSVKDVLAAQSGIFRPVGAEVHPVDGTNVLEFRFDAPSPFGLLTLAEPEGKQ